jgi:hypothetical protein
MQLTEITVKKYSRSMIAQSSKRQLSRRSEALSLPHFATISENNQFTPTVSTEPQIDREHSLNACSFVSSLPSTSANSYTNAGIIAAKWK